LRIVEGLAAFLVLAGVAIFDAWLLYRFFSGTQADSPYRASAAGDA